MADGRDHVLTEAAGITAGSWYASPATRVGHELVAAGMLILAGGGNGKPLDYTELGKTLVRALSYFRRVQGTCRFGYGSNGPVDHEEAPLHEQVNNEAVTKAV